jgi:hypothetical protein
MTRSATAGDKGSTRGSKAFRCIVSAFVVLSVFVAAGVVLWTMQTGHSSVERSIEAAQLYLALWRVFLFLVLIGAWRHWVELMAGWTGMSDDRVRYARSQRWRVAAWLTLIELILIDGLPKAFFDAWIH